MHKVRQIHQKKQGRNAGNRKKTLIIAMLTAILILSSISAYASQYLIQIKNNEGEVILSTIKPWKYSESEYNAKRKRDGRRAEQEVKARRTGCILYQGSASDFINQKISTELFLYGDKASELSRTGKRN